MTTTTKVLLAAFALFVGVLVVYYGIISPSAQPAPASATAAENPLGSSSPPSSPQPRADRSTSPGFLANSVNDALETQSAAREPLPIHAGPLGSVVGDPLVDAPSPVHSTSLDSQPFSAAPTANPRTPVSIDRMNIAGGPPIASVDPAPPLRATPEFVPTARSHAPASPSTRLEYTVKSGDTLSSIAESWFGESRKWLLIARENPLVDPNRLKIGQKLRMPPKDAALAAASPAPAASGSLTTPALPPSAGGIHTVKSGDSLSSIARSAYGDESHWQLIFQANKTALHNDPDALQVGMKLVIPKKPASGT